MKENTLYVKSKWRLFVKLRKIKEGWVPSCERHFAEDRRKDAGPCGTEGSGNIAYFILRKVCDCG